MGGNLENSILVMFVERLDTLHILLDILCVRIVCESFLILSMKTKQCFLILEFTSGGIKMVQILDHTESFRQLCKAASKFGMYISFDFGDFKGAAMAAPYLNIDDHFQIISDGCGILLFDTREEMENYYDMTVGDDGPTKLNNYNGLTHVYALTCDNTGNLLTKNT